jgi:hypothetical protein
MEYSIFVITIVALIYLHKTIKNSVGYIETRSEVLTPMAELQNKADLAELQTELDKLTEKKK